MPARLLTLTSNVSSMNLRPLLSPLVSTSQRTASASLCTISVVVLTISLSSRSRVVSSRCSPLMVTLLSVAKISMSRSRSSLSENSSLNPAASTSKKTRVQSSVSVKQLRRLRLSCHLQPRPPSLFPIFPLTSQAPST